jgi:hypothetical protein
MSPAIEIAPAKGTKSAEADFTTIESMYENRMKPPQGGFILLLLRIHPRGTL